MSKPQHDPAHGANRVTGSVKKAGSNRGIAAARKQQKREEAEARNKLTPVERTRAYRRKFEDAA